MQYNTGLDCLSTFWQEPSAYVKDAAAKDSAKQPLHTLETPV